MRAAAGRSATRGRAPAEGRRRFVRSMRHALAAGLGATLLAPGAGLAQSGSSALTARLDSAVRAHVDSPVIPGVSVAVVRGGEVLLQGGYGFVDLEWAIPTPPSGDASYEIGSVTKQFTAASVLLLVEEGLIDLDADFTEYVAFDTHGRSIPVRRLLDHTSGIRSYTEMEVFGPLSVSALPQDTLLRLVEDHPFDFEPGTAQIYNNSAFFILGRIIEAVSGRSYADFVRERLFEPAGMRDSYYCSETAMRAHRAHGYDFAGPGEDLIRARYLDHRWPYAAGSLCSTVADLVRWNRALHGGRILSEASYREMITPMALEHGVPVRYAMGIGISERDGHPVRSHGGGINGFLSQLSWFPDQELSVVVLQNATAPPGAGGLAAVLTDLVLGAEAEPPELAFDGDLGSFAGTYRGPARGQPMEIVVSVRDGGLELQPEGGQAFTPVHRGDLRWDRGSARYLFHRDGDRVQELHVDLGSGHYVLERIAG